MFFHKSTIVKIDFVIFDLIFSIYIKTKILNCILLVGILQSEFLLFGSLKENQYLHGGLASVII